MPVLGAREALYQRLHHNDAASIYSMKAMTWRAIDSLAHNLIHKRCAEDAGPRLPYFCA
jgi:hypothetical protein